MFIFIKFPIIKRFIIVGMILIIGGLGSYQFHDIESSRVFLEFTEEEFEKKIQQIIDNRNKAIVGDIKLLEDLYDKETSNGRWAYEQVERKSEYLKQWAEKQTTIIGSIDSKVFLRSIKEINEGYQLSLAVTTEYTYIYEDDSSEYENSSRMGTYHSIDLVKKDGNWKITREWYADPFTNASELLQRDVDYSNEIIQSRGVRDLTDLSDARKKAVKYADNYCGVGRPPDYSFHYNLDYKNYNTLGGNCTNYVSQVIHEAGMSKTPTWNYHNGEGNRAWVNASAFHNYMIYSGRGSVIASGTYEQVLEKSYDLLPGDYIALEREGKVGHNVVVSGVDSRGYTLVNGNNPDVYKVPWDFGWSNEGVKFHLVRVNY